jgi:aspartate dehydrogenase
MKPLGLVLVGCGAIGGAVLERLRSVQAVQLVGVVARIAGDAASVARLRRLGLDVPVVGAIHELGMRPDLCLECASHSALATHVVPALRGGISCIVTSVGALAAEALAEQLEAAAAEGGVRVELIAGAIGAIDALAAAREGGLDEVVYTGRKPAASWAGTEAERRFDLGRLHDATVIFEGSAREAAAAYPKNANVAATVALAGLGLDRTRALLVADPHATANVHRLQARGAFGRFDFTIEGRALPDNPRSSALAAWSAVRAVCNRAGRVVI